MTHAAHAERSEVTPPGREADLDEQMNPPNTFGATERPKLRVLDLFSGIGAYSLGLERTGGFQTAAFCEINPYCRRILRRHWPDVPIHEDVTALSGDILRAAGIVPDWIVAGWPCQDISAAGTGHGLDGARSGLWTEVARLAGELRPQGLLLENSANLLSINGGADFGRVLGDLAALGYDAEWHCLPAAAFDAPHIRDRLWIVARRPDAEIERRDQRRLSIGAATEVASAGELHQDGPHADPYRTGLEVRTPHAGRLGGTGAVDPRRAAERVGAVSDPSRVGRQPRRPEPEGKQGRSVAYGDPAVANADSLAPVGAAIARAERVSWEPEPDVGRVVHGAPNRVERIHALGNLNPPIVPEIIGRAILAAEAERLAA